MQCFSRAVVSIKFLFIVSYSSSQNTSCIAEYKEKKGSIEANVDYRCSGLKFSDAKTVNNLYF